MQERLMRLCKKTAESEEFKRFMGSYVCTFLINENWQADSMQTWACHSACKGALRADTPYAFTKSKFNPEWDDVEQFRKYMHWLVNLSPYADMFVVKDLEFNMFVGSVVSNDVVGVKWLGGLQLYRLPFCEQRGTVWASVAKLIESDLESKVSPLLWIYPQRRC